MSLYSTGENTRFWITKFLKNSFLRMNETLITVEIFSIIFHGFHYYQNNNSCTSVEHHEFSILFNFHFELNSFHFHLMCTFR